MVVKVVIAEDDQRMQLILRKTLEGLEDVKVIQEVGDGLALVEAVEKLKPDVVFLDIDMPRMDGLAAAKEIVDIYPQIFIIFATAYAQYHQEAFDVYAFDYLLKPFKLDRISRTMERVKGIIKERKLAKLYEKKVEGVGSLQKLMVQDNRRLHFLDTRNIVMVTRDERKTKIHLTGEKVIQTTDSLETLEQRLNGRHFFRTHKGYIINLNMLVSMSPLGKSTYELILANTRQIALATAEKAQELKKRFLLR
jgi:two-component system LytT family response regulator